MSREAAAASPPSRLWTRAEYERAGELGPFGPEERLELIAGEVIQKMTPQHSRHASGCSMRATRSALRSEAASWSASSCRSRSDRTASRSPSVYASFGIAEYCIVNLADRVLEVHRRPQPRSSEPLGHQYAEIVRLNIEDTVSPLAASSAQIRVADLIP